MGALEKVMFPYTFFSPAFYHMQFTVEPDSGAWLQKGLSKSKSLSLPNGHNITWQLSYCHTWSFTKVWIISCCGTQLSSLHLNVPAFECCCCRLYVTLVQHFEVLQSIQCDIRKHLINTFKMNLVVLKMMISDSATQPTLFSCVGSINCLKFFCIAMATLILQQPLTTVHRNAFTFQASCIPLLRIRTLPPAMKRTPNSHYI